MEFISPRSKLNIRKEKGKTLVDVVLKEAISRSDAFKIADYCRNLPSGRRAYLVQSGPKVKIIEYQGKKIPASNVFDCDDPSSIFGIGNSYYGYNYILKVGGEDEQAEKNIREIYDMLPTN